MATTRSRTTARASKGKRRKVAKISDLKQAAHHGRARAKDPRTAPSGTAYVPVSIVAIPPGQGPPMSSTPGLAVRDAVRSRKSKAENRRAAKSIRNIKSARRGRISASPAKRAGRRR